MVTDEFWKRAVANDTEKRIALVEAERDELLRTQNAGRDTSDNESLDFRSSIRLDRVVHLAAQLCEAEMGAIAQQRGEAFHYASIFNFPTGTYELLKNTPHSKDRGSVIGRVL